MIRLLNSYDTPSIANIWRECFTTDNNYIDNFINNCFPHSHTFGFFSGSIDKAVSILSILPAYSLVKVDNNLSVLKGYYVYGVGTLKNHRGKGYSGNLMEYLFEYAKNNNIQFTVLKPAQESLYNLYRKQSYNTTLYSYETTLELCPNKKTKYRSVWIDPLQYYAIRKKELSQTHILWSKDIVNYGLSELHFWNGAYKQIVLDNGKRIIYSIHPIDSFTLKIVDHNIKTNQETEYLKEVLSYDYPGFNKVIIELPKAVSQEIKCNYILKRNSMAKVFSNDLSIKKDIQSKIISLGME